MENQDVIVVGGGHNGLTAACYLGAAGRKVMILERRHVVGGAAVTEEFHPGYRTSVCSYVASLLHPTVVGDLDLERHGLVLYPVSSSFSPRPDGHYLLLTGDDEHDRREIGKFSNRDWEGKQKFESLVDDIADFVKPLMLKPPPVFAGGALGIAEFLSAGRLGMKFRALPGETRHRMVQFFTGSVQQLVERYIDSEPVQMLYLSSATLGTPYALDRPGTAINLLHLSLGEIAGGRGEWAFVRGGMGGISNAMAACARERGVEIRTNAPVEEILVSGGRVAGVRLESGEEVPCRCVMSNCEPKRTFLGMIDKRHLDPEFRADMAQWRTFSASFRMNLALSELPDFTCLPGRTQGPQHEGFISLKPSRECIDRAVESVKRGDLPAEPLVTMVIPSTADDSLAPPGHHVACIHSQHYPTTLSRGRSWDECRDEAADTIVETIGRYAPNVPGAVIARQALSPRDLEREFGLTGGDAYHGRLDIDQVFAMRPHPTCSGYRTPIDGLYLCGAGTHPGGGVSGLPGHNAAKVVIRDL